MLIRQIAAGIFGLSAGLIAAGGVFALITAVGVLTRLAGKSHTASHIITYENAVIIGRIVGNIMTIFQPSINIGYWGAAFTGIFMGIFVGCLATSLAENLNATSVFTRRVKLKLGMEYIVLSLAIGKAAGSLMYYYKNW